jgi:NADPH:quinone reductase-like Zn-dependent oxidoreductase
MRAISIREYGDPDGMRVIDSPEPSAAPGRLLIRTEAIGVGGVDAVIRRGTLGSSFPTGLIPGSEVAGEVVAVGDGVDPSWLDRRVWAFTGVGGGYVEIAEARVEDVVALPDGMSAVDAVTLGSSTPVAHFALAQAHLAAGESVLIRGAAGSIGIAAVQLAAAAGAREIAVTTSSPERGARLRELGATRVLDRAGTTDAETRFDIIFDVIGGAGLPAALEQLDANGRLVIVGVVGGYPPSDFGMTLMRLFQRSLSFSTFSLDSVPKAEVNRYRAEVFEAVARGEVTPVVHDVLPLESAADAHRRMDAGEVFGRIVLVP